MQGRPAHSHICHISIVMLFIEKQQSSSAKGFKTWFMVVAKYEAKFMNRPLCFFFFVDLLSLLFPSREHFRTSVTPNLHITYSKYVDNLGLW